MTTIDAAPVTLDIGSDGIARLWDLATGKPIGPPVLSHGATAVAASPDGRLLAAGGAYGRVVLKEMPRPFEGDPAHVRAHVEGVTGLELDDRGGVRELSPEEIRRRLD